VEPGLEDRLEDQLQAGLHDPVRRCRDPQRTQLAVRLGDHPLPHRQRRELARLELLSQPGEERRLTEHDGARSHSIDSGGSCTSTAPHPIPRHREERGIGDEVEQVIEPSTSIVDSPLVQLGLDLQYSQLGLNEARPRRVGVHRRPPGIPATVLRTRWVPSPCTRLSRARTTTGPPPRPGVISRRWTCPPTSWLLAGEGNPETVPTFTMYRSTGSAPSSAPAASPTATPQTFTVASPPT
jgi:hypothetical protein